MEGAKGADSPGGAPNTFLASERIDLLRLKKKRIGANEERIGPLSDERRKDILEITLQGGAKKSDKRPASVLDKVRRHVRV
jgi:hypothetical protein